MDPRIIDGVLHLSGTINIMAPRKMEKRNKRLGNALPADSLITFRMNDAKFAAVKEAASVLGMPYSEFIRWVVYASANEVLRIERVTREKQALPSPVDEQAAQQSRVDKARLSRQFVSVPKDFDPYKM